jgi:hypothetical protein
VGSPRGRICQGVLWKIGFGNQQERSWKQSELCSNQVSVHGQIPLHSRCSDHMRPTKVPQGSGGGFFMGLIWCQKRCPKSEKGQSCCTPTARVWSGGQGQTGLAWFALNSNHRCRG